MKYRIVISLFMCTLSCVAQDIHFSQNWMTPLLLNPAQTGSESTMRASLIYRNQWSSITSPFVTTNLSFDATIGGNAGSGYSAVGATIFSDNAGEADLKTLQGNLNYAYHVSIADNSTLGAGVFAGFAQRRIDYSTLTWGEQFDGSAFNSGLPTGEPLNPNTSLTYVDVGAGLHYKFGKGERYMTANDQIGWNAGIAVHHINQPKYSFYDNDEKLNLKEVGYVNAAIGISNSNITALPGVLYTMQGKAAELIVGSRFAYTLKSESKYTGFEHANVVSLGLHYRNKDAAIASLLVEIAQYAIGVSYDVNVSNLKTATNSYGAFEISLRWINLTPASTIRQSHKSTRTLQ